MRQLETVGATVNLHAQQDTEIGIETFFLWIFFETFWQKYSNRSAHAVHLQKVHEHLIRSPLCSWPAFGALPYSFLYEKPSLSGFGHLFELKVCSNLGTMCCSCFPTLRCWRFFNIFILQSVKTFLVFALFLKHEIRRIWHFPVICHCRMLENLLDYLPKRPKCWGWSISTHANTHMLFFKLRT